nr:acetyl-CoA hydrolase/transferase C-terminal domain-containing protein [Mycobacterium sp. ENV421]
MPTATTASASRPTTWSPRSTSPVSCWAKSTRPYPARTARRRSRRIVDRLDGPVTTGRADVQWVVTEHGAVDLRGLDTAARAATMCELAHPDHRCGLATAVRR